MSDIVERLRDPKLTIHGRAGMVAEAADEIERLRGAYAETRLRQAELETTESELMEALERIASISAGGPHPSPIEGMGAALASLDRARDIARDAAARVKEQVHD